MYKALISFSGLVCMSKGQIGEITDKAVADDLLRCGYIEEVTASPEETPKATRKGTKKTPKGG